MKFIWDFSYVLIYSVAGHQYCHLFYVIFVRNTYIDISRFVFGLRYIVMIVLRVHNKMIMSCLHPNINRMLNFYGIKIRQVIEYFSFLIGNRAYKWAFKEGTIKHKMVCAYILWFVNSRINDTK